MARISFVIDLGKICQPRTIRRRAQPNTQANLHARVAGKSYTSDNTECVAGQHCALGLVRRTAALSQNIENNLLLSCCNVRWDQG